MERIKDGVFLNPDKVPQIYENRRARAKRAIRAEWEIPCGSQLWQTGGETLISLPDKFAPQAHIMFGRFVWVRPEPGHVNPASPFEDAAGKQFQFICKLIFDSTDFEGWTASLLCRVTGRSSGARRREHSEPTAYLTAGDPVKLTAIQGASRWELSARSWWPTTDLEWKASSPDSFWPTMDVGLIKKQFASFPKVGAELINPRNLPSEHTELILHYPKFVAPANEVQAYVTSGQEQPPPPPRPDSTWDGAATAWWK